ncbi:MAG TPA: DNA polymerase III subunit delta' [Vicinamibacteria bacterium]|jgi:DNA polymerase-3 subunit delta'
MPFPEVIGHERVKGLLAAALAGGRLPPALLLTGPAGVGKKLLAQATARGLLCARGPGEPCDECATCGRVRRGLHPDTALVVPDGAFIKVDAVRALVREVAGRPFEGRARAYVLDDAHAMNDQAQNALLKSLEEPPPTSHLLLVTDAPQGLLPTIRSRCQTLRLGPLPARLLEEALRERHSLSAEDAHLRAALCGGSLGAALAFESDSFQERREELLALLESAARLTAIDRIEAADGLKDTGDPALLLTVLRSLLRDVAALAAGAAPRALLNADVAARLAPLAAGPLGRGAGDLATDVFILREDLRTNANWLLLLDALLDRLVARAA